MNESISSSGLMVKSFTVYKFLTLLSSPFSSFDAFRKGIIDGRGNYVKDMDEAFRNGSLDPLEVIIIKLKKIIATSSDPGLKSSLSNNLATFDLFLNEMYQYNVLPHESLYLLETHCLKKGFSLIDTLLEDMTVGGGGIPGLSITDIVGPKRRKKSKILRRNELMEMEVIPQPPSPEPTEQTNPLVPSDWGKMPIHNPSWNPYWGDDWGWARPTGILVQEFWQLWEELLRQLGDNHVGADSWIVVRLLQLLEMLRLRGVQGLPDNLPTELEPPDDNDSSNDSDGDGIEDWDDTFPDDQDNDGIPDAEELDTDNDGIIDDMDDDMDNDGIPNYLDNDRDNDGIYDVFDPDSPNWRDENGNGIHDLIEPSDPEFDQNGNGIDDAWEDGDNNGIPDVYDTDGDGIEDDFEDDDGDGIPNGNDFDSDNNGIPDYEEDDLNNNGIPDIDE